MLLSKIKRYSSASLRRRSSGVSQIKTLPIQTIAHTEIGNKEVVCRKTLSAKSENESFAVANRWILRLS